MRGTVAFGRRFTNPSRTPAFNPFSTSSSSGGRGRGRGGPTPFDFVDRRETTPGNTTSKPEHPPPGVGHGRGSGFPTAPSNPAFSPSGAGFGVGRGRVGPERSSTNEPGLPYLNVPASVLGGAVRGKVLVKEGEDPAKENRHTGTSHSPSPNVPASVLSTLSSGGLGGAGRGKVVIKEGEGPPKEENRHARTRPSPSPNVSASVLSTKSSGGLGGAGRGKVVIKEGEGAPKEENRHARTRPSTSLSSSPSHRPIPTASAGTQSKLSGEDALKRAVSRLARGESAGIEAEASAWGGRGRGRGRVRGRGEWRRDRDDEEEDGEAMQEDDAAMDDDATMEEVARAIGPETTGLLIEGFKEMSDRVLPYPIDDAFLDALHTNFLIELEPEYLMADFATNPDVDEKPPMPIPQVLDKVKPFMMAYNGLQNEEEWEEAVEETMKNLPLLKEIVDHYSGPDRVTAKKQQKELERVAKTIPPRAPASVHRFANRALLSLQSNPGWGFDKKCQFMDKLVREVSEH